jgi:hypothetical protein
MSRMSRWKAQAFKRRQGWRALEPGMAVKRLIAPARMDHLDADSQVYGLDGNRQMYS